MKYLIHESNLPRIRREMARLCRKAQMAGTEINYIDVSGVIRYNGWTVVGILESTLTGVICHSLTGQSLSPFTAAGCRCDHCGRKNLKKTIVLQHKDKGLLQVGRSCVKEFTGGIDADAVAARFSIDHLLLSGYDATGDKVETYILRDEYLAYAAETIRLYGFVPTSQSDCNTSTAQRARQIMLALQPDAPDCQVVTEIRDECHRLGFNAQSAKIKNVVDEALSWLQTQDNNSDFINNLQTICKQSFISAQHIGYLAALIHIYQRQQQHNNNKQQSGDFIGTPGERVKVDVASGRCVTSYPTIYGITYVYTFEDVKGNTLTWFASKEFPLDSLSFPVRLVGTVKQHKVYKGVKQTILTRCKVES